MNHEYIIAVDDHTGTKRRDIVFNPVDGHLYEQIIPCEFENWVWIDDPHDVQYLSSVYSDEIKEIDDKYHSDKIGRWS